MKVAICFVSTAVGGTQKRLVRILSLLSARESSVVDPWLVTNEAFCENARADDELAPILAMLERRGRLAVIPRAPSFIPGKAVSLWRTAWMGYFLYREGITIMHAALGGLTAAMLPVLMKPRVVLEVTSPDNVDTLFNGRAARFVYPRADTLHAISPSVERRLREQLTQRGYSKLTSRIVCAPLPFFLPQEKEASDPGEKENLIVFASRFIERKNPVLFAQAAQRFLKKNPKWKVAVLGFGPLEEQVRETLAAEIGAGRAEVGFTEEIHDYFGRSKIFVSLIRPDNYPSQSIMEAMQAGNAIVATDVGDTRKLVTEENGCLVDYDVEEVTAALIALANDETRRAKLGAASRRRTTEELEAGRYVAHLLQMYRENSPVITRA